MGEIWKPIKGYEGLYEISNLGRARSLKRATTNGKPLKLYHNKINGYVYITTSKDGVRKSVRAHKAVMVAFTGEHPGMQINHIDGDKTNNRLDNLEWCTGSENMVHAYKNDLVNLPTKQVIDLDSGKIFGSVTEASHSVGGNKADCVTRVCKGKRSHYRNHRFAYLTDYQNGTIPVFKGAYTKRSSESLWVNQAK